MMKYSKIKYHYEFPNLPINNNDIQALYEKMDNIIDSIYLFPEENRDLLSSLDIFISDDMPKRSYGKHDIKKVLEEIDSFRKEYPESYFNGLLADIAGTIRRNEEYKQSNAIKEITDYAERILEEYAHGEYRHTDGFSKIGKIISKLKNLKTTASLLGIYDYTKNRITLYIYNIAKHFTKAPNPDDALKIKTGLEIVLAHEVFHAIHFHMLGTNYQRREAKWNATPRHKDYQKCVTEGLARWFEYTWCDENQYSNDIYKWHMQETEDELKCYDYPGWPYAAAKAFIKNGRIDYPAAAEVFQMSLHYSSGHWKAAYQLLVDFDDSPKFKYDTLY